LDSLSRYQLGSDSYTRAEIDWLIAFFRARRGRAVGFRLKDWADFLVTDGQGRIGTGVANGSSSYQMSKLYVMGSVVTVRDITKPTIGAVLLRNGAVWAGATYDTATGLVTPPIIADRLSISDITKAAAAVLTVLAGHGVVAGETLFIDECVGMTEINGLYLYVSSVTPTTITLNIDSTGFSTYTGGGKLSKWEQDGDITWTGEFDVPVRFDTDKFETEFVGYRDSDHESLFIVSGLPLVEVRG